MAALASSGQISLDDIIKHRTGAASTDVSLKLESERFASGSVVDGDAAQTTARKNLDTAPYAISELYDADFPNSQFDTVVAKFGTATETEGYVDGETARIYVDVNQQINNTIRGGLKIRTTDVIAVVADVGTNLAVNTHYVNVTVPAADATTERYYAFADVDDSFKKSDSSVYLDHYDALGTVAITAVGTTTVANTSTDTSITHARSIVDDSSVNDYNWSFVKTSGDGSGVFDGESSYGTVTSTTSTPTIVYRGPATFTADLRVDGDPSQARNSSTATQVAHRIDYTKAISINNPSSLNEAATITATVSHQGFSSGIDVDLIQASDNSVLLSNDHGTDSRIVAVSNQDQTFTAPAQTAATLSVKVKGFDGSDAATSNAFNIYPLISQQFASGDLSFGASAVTVGQNVTLDVDNDVTDNIVGYAWSNQGSGNITVASGNASAGDTDGSANDSVSIIDLTDQSHPTVNFDTAQENKTIRLTLYGRLNQTATADKTINIELVDATTISAISSVNATTAVTVAGNQSGLSGGVTFGLVDTGATTTFLSGKSTSDTTDSRYTLDAYTANFTAADSNTTLTLQGRVIDRSDSTTGQNRNTSTFTVFPLLTTGKNTINPTSQTIYSTTGNTDTSTYPISFVFSAPATRTDNITTRTYSEGSSHISISANATPSSQTATQATCLAATTVAASENVTYTVTSTVAAGDSASDQSTATTCAVTINYATNIYNTAASIGGQATINSDITFSWSWQGVVIASERYELFDSEDTDTQVGNDLDVTDVTGGGVRTRTGSGSQTKTVANFGVSAGSEYVIKITLFSDSGHSTAVATALTPAFSAFAVTEFTSTIKGVGLEEEFFGYVSRLLAAENDSSDNGVHNRIISQEIDGAKLFALNVSAGTLVARNNTLTTEFNPLAAGVSGATFFERSGVVLNIGSDGVIDDVTDATPATLNAVTEVSDDTDDVTIRITGNTIVTRLVHVVSNTAIGGVTMKAITLSEGTGTTQQHTSYSKDQSLKALFGTGLADDATYAITVRGVNASESGSLSASANVTTDALPDPSWGSWNATPSHNLGVGNATRYSATYNVTLTDPDTGSNQVNATISNVSGMHGANTIYVAVGTATNPTNYVAAGSAAQMTAESNPDVIYIRFKIVAGRNNAENGTFTLTMENGGISKTDTGLEWSIEEGG